MALPAILVLVGLGTWQLERLEWKRGLIATIEARTTTPPIPLPAAAEFEDLEYRAATVTGTFDHDHELYVVSQVHKRAVGLHVVTPLRRSDGRGTVLVNRGWVPPSRREPAARPAGQVTGEVTVLGLIRVPRPPGWMAPDNAPTAGTWYRVAPQEMAAALGRADVAPVWLDAAPDQHPGDFPIGGQTILHIPNDHLQYAFTWYALAGALAVIYVLFHLRRETAP